MRYDPGVSPQDLQRLAPVAAQFVTGAPDAAAQMVGLTINVPGYAQLALQVLDQSQVAETGVSVQLTIDQISLADMAGLRDSISAEIARLTTGQG